MKAFLKRLKLTFTLFSSQNIDETVQESFESLNQMFETLDCAAPTIKETTLDYASEDEGVTPIEADEIDVKINLDKPFKAYIMQQMNGYKSCSDKEKPNNEYHIPGWISILVDKWLAFTPFWTSILRGRVKIVKICNNSLV